MPYMICEGCNQYHEINSREEGTGWDNCKCGKPFKYYESLEECLFEKNKELITKFINSYESTVARLILFSLSEMPFPVGFNKTINVLRGSKAAFIIDNGLNKLLTYSLFYYFSKMQLKLLIESLIAEGFIKSNDVSFYQRRVLSLTDRGTEFLLNEKPIKLNIVLKKNENLMEGVDKELYEKLRSLRNQIARKKEFPPYLICNNEPLREMARSKPTNQGAMISIKGIGKGFMENYGEIFLKAIDGQYDKTRDNSSNPEEINSRSNNSSKADESEVVDICITLFNDVDADKRAHAAFLLGERGDPNYIKFLSRAAKDKDSDVRKLVASALGKIGDKSAENDLINLLEDSTPETRRYAAIGLGKIRSVKSLIPLKRLRSDPVHYVRDAVEDAISDINSVD